MSNEHLTCAPFSSRSQVGHAIRRAVEEMSKKSKKRSKSKQAIKGGDKGKIGGEESLAVTQNKQKGANGKLEGSNMRTLQDVSDTLVVPPFLFQPTSQPTLESNQTRPLPNLAHSMQQSLAVQPSTNLLAQAGNPSFDIFSRHAARMEKDSLSNQLGSHPSQQAFNLMNQINAVRDGSLSGSSFSNQLQMANRLGKFGATGNELNQVGDNGFLQSNQMSNNAFLSGLSNQINSMQSHNNNSLQQFASLSSQVGQDAASRSFNSGLLASAGATNPMHSMLAADFLADPSGAFQQQNSNAGM